MLMDLFCQVLSEYGREAPALIDFIIERASRRTLRPAYRKVRANPCRAQEFDRGHHAAS
jgi:hypothetical protein